MTLTGLLVFIEDGTISQVIVAAFIALAWLSLYGTLAPFADTDSDVASTAAQYMIYVQLFIAVLIKAGAIGATSQTLLTVLLITMNLVPPSMLVAGIVGSVRSRSRAQMKGRVYDDEATQARDDEPEPPLRDVSAIEVELTSAEPKAETTVQDFSALNVDFRENSKDDDDAVARGLAIGLYACCDTTEN